MAKNVNGMKRGKETGKVPTESFHPLSLQLSLEEKLRGQPNYIPDGERQRWRGIPGQ